MNKEIIAYKSEKWDRAKPRVSVITPIYNRAHTIERTFRSVANQSYKDYEYILVDNGSSDNIDEVLFSIVKQWDFPILFIKKEYGGVNTSRNMGIKYSRGELTLLLDSDDEILSTALQVLVKEWDSIPISIREQYRGVVALCQYNDGRQVGECFPENINDLSKEKANDLCDSMHAEHVAILNSKILKENPWPEPEGITYVGEDIVWKRIERMYRTRYVNQIVRIYHMDSGNSATYDKKRTLQYCIDNQWNYAYRLNNWEIYKSKKESYFRVLLIEKIFEKIIILNKEKPLLKLERFMDKFIGGLLFLPSYIGAIVYINKKFTV